MTLSRRTVLKGLLGGAAVSIALPPLEFMMNSAGTAWADGSAFPTRFAMWLWGNGVTPSRWVPSAAGAGDAWQLSDQLAPLAAHKSKLVVASGFEARARNTIPHLSGFGAILTGLAQVGEEGANTYAGPTIDQQIAAEVGSQTAYRSIETGGWFTNSVSHNGPYSPNPPETVPHALFDRLFGTTFVAPGEDARIDPRLALRRSVLDVVEDRVTALQSKLGTTDRRRLDQHLTGIRDLELLLARLEAGPPDLAACSRPGTPGSTERLGDAFLNHRAMCDLLAMAYACDQTRVVSMSFMHGVSNYLFPGAIAGHHELTHNEPPEAGDFQPQVHANTVASMQEFAYFLSALDAVPEGDGTLLDHSVVLGTTDVSWGFTHSIDEYPLLLAGSANGVFKQNQHYRSTTRENPSKIMLSIVRAMGISAASYGDEDRFTKDGLSAIEV